MAVLDVLQEIIDRERRLVGIELDDDGTGAGLQFDLRFRRAGSARGEQAENGKE